MEKKPFENISEKEKTLVIIFSFSHNVFLSIKDIFRQLGSQFIVCKYFEFGPLLMFGFFCIDLKDGKVYWKILLPVFSQNVGFC